MYSRQTLFCAYHVAFINRSLLELPAAFLHLITIHITLILKLSHHHHHLFSFCGSIQDYKIHMDMEISHIFRNQEVKQIQTNKKYRHHMVQNNI